MYTDVQEHVVNVCTVYTAVMLRAYLHHMCLCWKGWELTSLVLPAWQLGAVGMHFAQYCCQVVPRFGDTCTDGTATGICMLLLYISSWYFARLVWCRVCPGRAGLWQRRSRANSYCSWSSNLQNMHAMLTGDASDSNHGGQCCCPKQGM